MSQKLLVGFFQVRESFRLDACSDFHERQSFDDNFAKTSDCLGQEYLRVSLSQDYHGIPHGGYLRPPSRTEVVVKSNATREPYLSQIHLWAPAGHVNVCSPTRSRVRRNIAVCVSAIEHCDPMSRQNKGLRERRTTRNDHLRELSPCKECPLCI
jgi:hypothetical protein